MENREYQDMVVEAALPILLNLNLVVLNMECRTGKTFTSLKLAQKVNPKKVLIITQISAFDGIKKDIEAFNPSFEIDMVNIESLHKMGFKYDLVIFDEYHNLRYTQKQKVKNKKFHPYSHLPRIGLTGTLFPEGYASAYSLFEPEFSEYKDFYQWFSDFGIAEQKRFGKRVATLYEKTHKDKIFARINKYIVALTQKDAGFYQFAQETVHMLGSMQVEKIGKMLAKDKYVRYGKGDSDIYLADNISKEFSAFCQLQGGTLKLDDDKFLIVDRFKVKYINDNFRGKIAIYYKYKADLIMIKENMPKNWTCCETVEEFRDCDGDCYFPGQFRSKREGITLDFCNILIFYGMPHSNLDYLQSKERMLTKNKVEESFVHFLITEFEHKIYETVKKKKGKFNSESYKQWQRTKNWNQTFKQV